MKDIDTLNQFRDKTRVDLCEELQKQEEFLQDAAAYLRHSFNEGTDHNVILTTLVHDICGLANKERCFLPRVSGYAEKEGTNDTTG